jgi:hypothetical protein
MTMTDAEIADQVRRADAFVEQLRAMIAETTVDPESPCAEFKRQGLQRIAETLDAVPFVTFANLSTLDLALQRRIGSKLMSVIELHLMSVGSGPELDYESATGFLAQFEAMIDAVRKQRIN